MSLDSEISEMENEIIMKSGIQIQKNKSDVKDLEEKTSTPSTTEKLSTSSDADEKAKRPEDMSSPPGAMLLGKEEDIKVL